MRIQTSTGIDFDLPTGFAAELSRYNVLLSDAGEQTAPITLPGTPKNLQMVGYSDRIDNVYKPLTDLDVTVIDGLFHRQCNLGIHTANAVDGISCTIYLDSGEFYSKVGSTRMQWLSWPEWKSPSFDTQTLAQRVQYLIDLFKAEYDTPTDSSIYGITPVQTSQTFKWRVNKRDAANAVYSDTIEEVFNLNDFEKYQADYFQFIVEDPNELGYTDKRINKFAGEFTQTQIVDSADTNISLGYGMTPFLKINYVLETIFEHFGFTLDKQTLISHIGTYEKICVLNNVADAIYSGILKFKQLVPDVTIKEFISKVEELFCGKFIFNNINKTIIFKSYKQVLPSNSDIDLTEFLCARPKLNNVEFKTIRIVDENATAKTNENETNDETSTLSFKFTKLNTVSHYFYCATAIPLTSTTYTTNLAYSVTNPVCTFSLTRILNCIDEIIHLNSSIVIDNKTQTESSSASTQVYFACVNNTVVKTYDYQTRFIYQMQPGNLSAIGIHHHTMTYKTNYRMFEGNGSSDLDYIKTLYDEFILFSKNSNIPIEAEMNIPASDLERMDLHVPKILQGQPVMIESIKYALGKKGTQAVRMRTLRPYQER
jgi:hypothetical protein